MRPRLATRSIQIALTALVIVAVLLSSSGPQPARAGGSTIIGGGAAGFGPDGVPFVWMSFPIGYTVDGGNLGALNSGTTPTPTQLVDMSWAAWANIPTSSLSFQNNGALAMSITADGDVDTMAEFNNAAGACTGNPIMFDADGTLTAALGFPPGLLGFAGASCPGSLLSTGEILSGLAFLNGGQVPTTSAFDVNQMIATMIHEGGHFLGFDHDQGNDFCQTMGCANGSAALFGRPTMTPFATAAEETTDVPPEMTPSLSDISIASRLYPETVNSPPSQIPFTTAFATITGDILSSDGQAAIQGTNVIARYATNIGGGFDETQACIVGGVSGARFTGNFGQTVTGTNPTATFGSRNPSLYGLYELPVPVIAIDIAPGVTCPANTDYTVEVESLNPNYSAAAGNPGSTVGPTGQGFPEGSGFNMPLPGAGAEFLSSPETNSDGNPGTAATITVTAGMTHSGNNIILNGTPPGRDAFEPNDTTAAFIPVGNGTPAISSANISGFSGANPDVDVYGFTALANTPVTLEIFAERAPHNDLVMDSVIDIVNAAGTLQNLCVSPGFTTACVNDDSALGGTLDSRLEVRSGVTQTLFVRVRHFYGNPHPSHLYDLHVSNAGAAPPPPGFTKEFDGGPAGTGTDWATAANWNPDGLPIATDDVLIGAAFNVTKASAGGDLINNLTVNGSLTNQAGSGLTINGTLVVASPLTVAGGAVSVNGPANVNQLNLNGGTLNVSSTPGPLNVTTFTMTGGAMNVNTVFNALMPFTQSGGSVHLPNLSSSIVAPMITLTNGIIDGFGSVNADVNQTGGNINPGSSPGILAINGNWTQAAAGVINIELGGTTPGNLATNHDQFNISGTATVDGTFRILQFGSFAPNIGDSFTIAQCLSGVNCGSGNTQLDFSMFPLPADRMFVDVSPGTNNMLVIQVQAVTTCEIDFDNDAGNGDWTNAMNWTGDVLPGSSGAANDDACIGVTAPFLGPFTVTKSGLGGDSINGLTIADGQGVFTLSSNLTIAAASTIGTGGFAQTAGPFTLAATLDVSGPYIWSGGTQVGSGTTNANGGINVTGIAQLDMGRTLNNPAAATISGGGRLDIGNGAVFNNPGTVDIQNNGSVGGNLGGVSTFTNSGTLTKSGGGGTSNILATFNNPGTVNVNSGTLSLNNGSTNSGALNVGATLQFLGGTHDLNSGAAASGAGTTAINGAVNFNAGSSITTAVSLSGGTANFLTGLPVTLPSLTQSAGTLTGTDMVNITAAFAWSGGSQDGAGTTNANGGMNITGGVTLNTGRILNNTGAGTMSGAGILFLNSGATFNNSGTFDIQNIGQIVGGGQNFNNSGTLTKSGGGGTSIITCIFSNTGTVNANNGDLNFSGSFTQTGGASLTRLNGGTLGGGITFNFNGGILDAVGGSTISGNVNNAGASVRPGMSPGTLNIVGNYVQGAGGALNIELGGVGAGQFDVLAITGSATLAGTLNVQSFGGFIPGANMFQVMTFASLVGDFGTFNNTSGNPGLTTLPGATNYVLSFAAAACTINFDNSNGTGLWQDPLNWDTNVLPGPADDVCITGFTVIKSAAGGDSINSLTVDDTSGAFTLSDNLSIAATSTIGTGGFTHAGGTFNSTGSLTVNGPYAWAGGTQSGTGVTDANGGITISPNIVALSGRTLNNAMGQTVTISGGARLDMGNGAVFNNPGTVDIQNDGSVGGNIGGANTFNHSGTLTKSGGVGASVIAATFNNTGTVNANSGTLSLDSTSTHTGATFNVSATLRFNPSTHTLDAATSVTGAGTVSFNGTTDVNGTYNITGGTTFNAGTTNFNAASTVTSVGALTINNATVNFSSGDTITPSAATQTGGVLTGTDTLTLGTLFTWSGGSQSGAATTNANAGINMNTNPVALDTGRTLNNAMGQAVTISGGARLDMGNGAVFNNPGTVDIQNDGSVGGNLGGVNTFNHSGTLTKSGGAGSSVIAATFNNTGTVNANSGTLSLNSASTNTGATFNVSATLRFAAGSINTLDAASSITGTGTVDFSGGTTDIDGTYNITGASTFNGGTANFNAASTVTSVGVLTINAATANFSSGDIITPSAATQGGGVLTGTDTVTLSTLFAWSGGSQGGAGTTNANAGINITNTVALNTGRTLNNAMGQTVTISGSGRLDMGGGAVFNNPGTVDIQNNGSVGGNIGGANTFNNSGTLTKSGGGATSVIAATFNNTGTTNANNGTLSFSNTFTQTAGLTRLNGGNLGGGITFDFNGGILDAVGGSTITGNVNIAGATMRPGMSPGLLNIVGNYIQSATGVLDIELGGFTPGTQFDVVAITGSATLDGTLNVNQFGVFVPSGSFQIMTFGSRLNNFAAINNNTPGTGFAATPGTNDYVVSFAVAACNINAIASGDWANTATWSGAAVPTAGDNPCIDADQFTVAVSAGAQAANSLTVTGIMNPFTLSGGSLDLAAASSIAGQFIQSGGTFTGAGLLTITGPFFWAAGTQSGPGATTASSVLALGGTLLVLDGRTLNNVTTASFNGTNLQMDNGAVFNNQLGALFDMQVDADISFGSGAAPAFNNAGTFTKSAGAGTSNITVAFNNTGSANVNSGTLNLPAGGTSTGSFNAAVTTTLSSNSGTHNMNAGAAVSGAGTFLVQGTAVMNFNAGSSLTAATILAGAPASALTLNTGGAVTLPSFLHVGGTLGGADTFNVAGPLTWNGGTQSGGGITNANGPLGVSGTTTLDNRTLNNTLVGVWNPGGGSLQMGNGAVFNNAATATFDQQSDGTLGGGVGGANTFNNAGTYTKSGGAAASIVNAAFLNSGTFSVGAGTLTFASTFTQTAGLTTLTGGTISGALFDFNGGVLDAVGGSTITGNVNNTGATVRPGMSPGTLTITGTYTQGAGGALDIELGGTGAGQFDVLAVGGVATLGGTLNVISFMGFTPVTGDSFNVMTYASFTGDFATKNGLNISTPTMSAAPQPTFYLLSVAVPVADLAITKTDSPDPVNVGQNLTYTVTVNNLGPDPATNVVVTDTLPAGVTFVSTTGCAEDPAGVPTCTLGTIANGGMASYTITVTPQAAAGGTTITNTASVTTSVMDPNAANNTVMENTTVNGVADLAITKIDSPDPVDVNQNLTYTVTVTNNGPDTANNVVMTDTLPANVGFAGASPSQGTCMQAAGTVTCTIGSLANGASAVITITVTPNAAAPPSVTNTASVSATDFDPNLADNTAVETTTVNPVVDLSVLKTDTPDPVLEGQNVTYDVTVSNNGPSAATNVTLTDTLPASVNFVSATPSQGACGAPVAGVLTCTLGTIASGTNALVTIVVTTTNASVPSISNTASVTSTETDSNNANNSDTETTTVTPLTADLSITKTDSPDPVTEGQNITYTITVANAGPDAATNVTVTDVIPAGVTFAGFVSISQGSAVFSAGTNTVTASFGTINNGANATIVFTVSTSTASVPSVSNTATVSATEVDPVAGNNSATEITTVNPAADLAVTKTDAADPVNVGQNIVYTITVSNAGPSAAPNVVLTDTLPAAVTFVNAVPSQGGPCTLVGVTLTCPLGTINTGANATVMITVTAGVLAAPSVTNTASVAATATDPVPGNNMVSEMTTVNPVADLALTKTDSPDPVVISNNITYTLTVTNNGPSPATVVVIDDPLPANVTFVSLTAPAGSMCTTPAVGATGTVNCTLPGMLASGANASITIVVQAPATAGMVSNTATVTSAITDPVPANNTATADTTVSTIIPSTDFSLTAVPINNNVIVGQSGTYTVTVGPLPAGTSFTNPIALACMSPTGTCTIAPNSLTPGANPASATMTVETAALLGSVPPVAPVAPEPAPPVSPVFALWTFLAGLMLVSLGYVGKKTQRRQLAHCLTFGLVLLVIAGAVGQSACATRVRRQVSGPYTVTVTATSGALSHSTTVTLNVTQP